MRVESGPAPGMLLGKIESHRNERDPEAVQTSSSTVWFGTNQAEVGGHVIPKADEGRECRRCKGRDNEQLPTASRRTESHQNERDPEAV
ncbi:hypothetical protein MTR_7g104880 [Medicago truncatula]|nr:hypothetical protein MTR_7g104880 [Medicago truncatula]